VDKIIEVLSGPLVDRGVLGITTLLFLGLYLWTARQRSLDQKAFSEERAGFVKRIDELGEDRVTETRALSKVVTEFSLTSQIILELAKKGA
jgi:hypothetical protein